MQSLGEHEIRANLIGKREKITSGFLMLKAEFLIIYEFFLIYLVDD